MNKDQKQNVIDVIKIFYEIEETRGTNAKKELLLKYKDNKSFLNTLIWFFDITPTGIAARKLQKDCIMQGIELQSLEEFLSYINNNNTGSDIDVGTVQKFSEEFLPKIAEGVLRLAQKKWGNGLGIEATTVNAVYGDNFIKTFKIQLCHKYWDDPEYYIGKRFGLQVKLDGYCFILIKRNGGVRLFARSGKEYTGQFPEIENEALNLKADNFVLHGERMPLGFLTMDNKQQFKLAASGQQKGEKTGFCIAVYDYVDLKNWDRQVDNWTYDERYSTYMEILRGCKYLFPLPCLYIGEDIGQITKWFNWAVSNSKEGIIVKNMNANYEWDRSRDCVKLKTVYDADLKVVGFEEGRGKLKGSCGALLLEYEGGIVQCGSGLKEFERAEIWSNKEKYLGKIVEINYMEISSDKNGKKSLRHPIFKCFKTGE
jgi:DNA ligase-1